ncbi:hypothetical protein DRO97_04160 [Archaeoglobales archaeon]|nr:MAG: hypothetical protein DRO97_04160 [Archaeoglobales archaeon]
MPLSIAGNIFAAMFLCMLGVGLIAYTGGIPFLNILTTFIGWGLIIVGSMVGINAVFPQAFVIFGWAFLFIFIAGLIVIIYQAIRGPGPRSPGGV